MNRAICLLALLGLLISGCVARYQDAKVICGERVYQGDVEVWTTDEIVIDTGQQRIIIQKDSCKPFLIIRGEDDELPMGR